MFLERDAAEVVKSEATPNRKFLKISYYNI